MFNVIACATDGSAHGDQALDYAKQLAEDQHAALRVVHVVDTIYGGRATGQNLRVDEDQIIAKVKAQTAELRQRGLDASLHVVRGSQGQPAHQIAISARDAMSDVLVIGTRGRTTLGGLLLGSVAQRLLHIAPCPILVIPSVSGAEPGTLDAAEQVTASAAG
jgi:nucleotide-binding universal stress UspA family protein